MKEGILFLTIGCLLLAFFVLTLCVGLIVRLITKKKEHKLWKIGLIAGIVFTAITFAIGFFIAQTYTERTYQIITDKNLSHPYTVAMMSDLHYGTVLNASILQDVCDDISEQNPDFVIIDGDVVDESTTEEQVYEVFRVLAQIKSKQGVYFVYGNHDDMAANVKYENDLPRSKIVEKALSDNKIKVLEDASVQIENDIVLIGRKDLSVKHRNEARKTIRELLSQVDKSKFLLLADHQPYEFSDDAQAGIDLTLCGHTHDGQIWPLGFFSELIGLCELSCGQEQYDQMTAIVSSGLGEWGFPTRTGRLPEYLMITIASKQNE